MKKHLQLLSLMNELFSQLEFWATDSKPRTSTGSRTHWVRYVFVLQFCSVNLIDHLLEMHYLNMYCGWTNQVPRSSGEVAKNGNPI